MQYLRTSLNVFTTDGEKINLEGDGDDSWIVFRVNGHEVITIFLDYTPQDRLTQLSHFEEQLVEHIGRLKAYIAQEQEKVAAAPEGDDTEEFHDEVEARVQSEDNEVPF